MRPGVVRLGLVGVVLAAAQAIATVPVPNPVPPTPGSTSRISGFRNLDASTVVFDGRGKIAGKRDWVLSNVGGNCCETRLTVTRSGRLLEFGGTDLIYSDDEGDTWSKVSPVQPLVAGEGDVVAAPNGDIVAVGWDVYSGDRLQSYKYTAATKKWEVGEVLLRSPAFDRPWITVVKGPLKTTLGTVPYGVVLQGGIAIGSKLMYFSSDGLHYDEVLVPRVDDQLGKTEDRLFKVAPDPDADYWAAAAPAGSTTLTGGGAVLEGGDSSCSRMRMIAPSTALKCVVEPLPPYLMRQDSNGTLVRLQPLEDKDFALETSKDGGRTWRAARLTSPVRGTFDGVDGNALFSGFKDLAVNGRLGFAAVLVRIGRPAENGAVLSQDAVYIVDTTGTFPVVREILFVGNGGLSTRGGLDPTYSGPRLDFSTLAIHPSGRIVTGYYDTESDGPALAFERGVSRGRGGVVKR